MTLRYDKMRIGEYVASRSQKQVAFERGMKTAFEWYRREASERCSVEDDYALEVRLLSDISRLYMEHYHFIQQSRRRETANFVGRSKKLMDEVLSAIEKQNYYIYDETGHDIGTGTDGSDFVDIDAVSEIVFDKLDMTQQFESQITVEQVPVETESVSLCSGRSTSGGAESAGGLCGTSGGCPCKQRRRRKRQTLLQKMALYKAAL